MKAYGAEKRGFGFPNCMRFREQIGAQFFGWNVCLQANVRPRLWKGIRPRVFALL